MDVTCQVLRGGHKEAGEGVWGGGQGAHTQCKQRQDGCIRGWDPQFTPLTTGTTPTDSARS